MASFMDSLKTLTSFGPGRSGSLTKTVQSSMTQAASQALSSTLNQPGSSLQKGLEKAENLVIADRVITYTLYGISAAAALGILIVQIKTYKKVYGKKAVAANPRRRHRR